ncbi:MAG: hypothetical protein F2817_05280 [Actinobacteria bacterium]|nr:hypothetical protein [Actinomycetota bacterium]
MTQIPGALRPTPAARPSRSLFEILGTLGPAAGTPADDVPFRAACVLEAARRGRPAGPPRPTPHGVAPPAG